MRQSFGQMRLAVRNCAYNHAKSPSGDWDPQPAKAGFAWSLLRFQSPDAKLSRTPAKEQSSYLVRFGSKSTARAR